jgi:hypothetical protein
MNQRSKRSGACFTEAGVCWTPRSHPSAGPELLGHRQRQAAAPVVAALIAQDELASEQRHEGRLQTLAAHTAIEHLRGGVRQ